jgi:hypothetical protein
MNIQYPPTQIGAAALQPYSLMQQPYSVVVGFVISLGGFYLRFEILFWNVFFYLISPKFS